MTQHQSTSLVPMLSVRKGASAIDFHKEALGAVEPFRIENESGEIVEQLSVGSAEFWLADEAGGPPAAEAMVGVLAIAG